MTTKHQNPLLFTDYHRWKKKNAAKEDRSSTTSSQISTSSIEKIIDKLRTMKYQDSMKKNYYAIWKIFNKFIIRLDEKPTSWEHRLTLFIGHLIQSNKQSSTVKS